MRAIVVSNSTSYEKNHPTPTPSDDEALIEITTAGICNTDLEIIKGYMHFRGILGHEFVGKVIECKAEPNWVGQRVVGEINVADGTCDLCVRGIPSQCRNRTTVGIDRHDGAFADLMALSARNLHSVPNTITDDQAVFVEPLAAAMQILEQVHITANDRVALIGAGKLGLLAAQVVKLTCADLTVVVRREKPAHILRKWGIQPAVVTELTPKQYSVVIDCTGIGEGFAIALDLVQPRGTIVLKSTYNRMPTVDLTRAVVDEIQIIGSRCGPFDAAIRLLEMGVVDTTSLIEARYPIDQGMSALERAAEPGALKVLIHFQP